MKHSVIISIKIQIVGKFHKKKNRCIIDNFSKTSLKDNPEIHHLLNKTNNSNAGFLPSLYTCRLGNEANLLLTAVVLLSSLCCSRCFTWAIIEDNLAPITKLSPWKCYIVIFTDWWQYCYHLMNITVYNVIQVHVHNCFIILFSVCKH